MVQISNIFLCSFTAIIITNAKEIIFNDIRKNKLLLDALVLQTIDNFTHPLKCQQHCILHKSCESVNFNESQKKCRLLKITLMGFQGPQMYKEESGWTYYGQKKSFLLHLSDDLILDNLISLKKERLLEENLTTTFPVLYKEWRLSFSIKLIQIFDNHVMIIHATVGGNNEKHGDRTPLVYFNPNSLTLMVSSTINNKQNTYFSFSKSLLLGVYSNVEISQTKNENDGKYYLKLVLNNEIHENVVNEQPKEFSSVKVYTGSPFYNEGNAYIKDVLFYTIKK